MSGYTKGPKDGGRAFPNDGMWANGTPEGGMALRDWFAGQALQGLLASPAHQDGRSYSNYLTWVELADSAYAQADAMIAKRSKKDDA